MRIQAPHCPGCGAPLSIPVGVTRHACAWCARQLVIEAERVVTAPRAHSEHAPATEAELAELEEPEVSLSTREARRFELSFLEQRLAGSPPEVFAALELGDERFAVVNLRLVDDDGRPVSGDLKPAFDALTGSLEDDGDPGLAANLALDALCAGPFEHGLECVVLLFEPKHMRVTAYDAGCNAAVWWASSEEGRSVHLGKAHDRLQRKMLRESRDHFSNAEPIHLAATDVVVFASAGFLGRGARGYASGSRVLSETLDEHLGEAPLRIVTLAKNGFWDEFRKRRHGEQPWPVGDVNVAAVRPILPPLATELPPGLTLETMRTKRFEVSVLRREGEALRLLSLHDERHVLVWLSHATRALQQGELDLACEEVTAVLDRREHGDNENPRLAGRNALAKLGLPEGAVRLAVVQLFDRYQRVKYFRAGWKQPLGLAERGVRDGDAGQQFDDGGEATVKDWRRLFFPGGLDYEGQAPRGEDLARVWAGGKASRLYEALNAHWKTKKTDSALRKLALAAASDAPESALHGLMLVTGLPL